MKKKKKVYVPMAIDILHTGHLNIIEVARNLGDVTIGLLTDEAIVNYKRLPMFEFKERKRIVNVEQFANWAAEHGVDRNSVLDTFTSFGVDSMLSHALDMTPRYETDGVPTIIIDGKYRTKVSQAGGHNELIDLINHLATVASDERQQ